MISKVFKILFLVSLSANMSNNLFADSNFSGKPSKKLTDHGKNETPAYRRITINSNQINQNQDPIKIYIQGGLHGNERLTVTFVRWLSEKIATEKSLFNQVKEKKLQFDFVDIANPEGYQASNRYNENGVNLNRNFSIHYGNSIENPGKHAFSESQTQKIRNLLIKERYDYAIDIHGYTNWLVVPSQLEQSNRVLAAKHKNWTNHVRSKLNLLPGYVIKTPLQLGDGGAFEDWAFWDTEALSLCLELSSSIRNLNISTNDSKQNIEQAQDSFLQYEKFLYHLITDNIKNPHDKIAH